MLEKCHHSKEHNLICLGGQLHETGHFYTDGILDAWLLLH